jgi:hypothetical protein
VEALKRAGRTALELYPRGFRLFWLAPAVLALVVVPEAVQHVVEIRLGMFESKEAFRALQFDPTRMAVGYVKSAGVFLTILAAARFWWTRSAGGAWYDPRGIAWGRLLVGFLLFGLVPLLPELAAGQIGKQAAFWIGIGLSLVLLPMLFLMIAGLFGDRDTPVSAMWRRAWPWLILTAALAILAFVPAGWLHRMNHEWALGAPLVLVWALMIFDSLLVGLLAGLTGTAFYLGYAAFARPDPE